MSSQPSSQYSSPQHSRMHIYTTSSYQNSAKTYYTPYEPRMTPSSSPPRSSSPPMTPYSTRHALIRSSPEIASDALFNSIREHMEDPSLAWGHRYSSNEYPERAYTSLKDDRFSAHSYPPPSDFDVSEYSEDVDHDIPEVDSEHTSDSAPNRNSVFFSDTEEEENDGNDGFSFGHGGYRTTFFRTSAERGQWKSHPIPFKSTSLPQARRSASIPSKPPTPVLVDSTRTSSEPALSTVTGLGFCIKPDQYDNLRGADGPLQIPLKNVAESELQPVAESPHTMPSLTSDWESIPDIDGHRHRYERPPSPLPPSSPMSYSVSILSRSVSPASSPVMRSSSPLSEISSLDQEERHVDEVEDVHISHHDIEIKIRSSISTPTFTLDADIKGHALDDVPASSITPSLKPDPATLSVDATVISALEPFNPPSAAPAQNPDHETKYSSSIAGDEADITSGATDAVPPPDSLMVNYPTDSMDDQSQLLGITHAERPKPADAEAIREYLSIQMEVEDDNKKHAVKRRRRKGNGDDEHPILKKRKVDAKVGRVADLLRPLTHDSVRNEKTETQAKKDEKDPDQEVSAKLRRRRKGEVEVSVSCPASSTKCTKPHRPLPKASSSHSHITGVDGNDDVDDRHQPVPLPNTQDPKTAALSAEISGMLIETMALSRASSLPLSSLYKMVMQTQPSLKSQRSEQEWLTVFARVLHEGEAGRGNGVFGKVESSGKDDSNQPLEAQWFYVPEQDEDQERAALIRSMMPRPAKRTETKKYKQYYWRPLDKISRWDPEDEL